MEASPRFQGTDIITEGTTYIFYSSLNFAISIYRINISMRDFGVVT
jgi:hypothetical protein